MAKTNILFNTALALAVTAIALGFGLLLVGGLTQSAELFVAGPALAVLGAMLPGAAAAIADRIG